MEASSRRTSTPPLPFPSPDLDLDRLVLSNEQVISSPSSPTTQDTLTHEYISDAVQAQLSETDLGSFISSNTSKVLIIYTGGTIGMHHTKEHGYVPLPNYLYQLLSTNYRFHQCVHEYDTFLYNEVWMSEKDEPLLLPALITAPSLFGKRIQYSILEYDPLLDSSNMTMKDWIRLAKDIELNYTLFDAFIILHGTDTMAYTSSILSFMLENLDKTVILTGSQIPIMEVRNDAIENLLGALQIAGHFVIPEVTLFFNQKLFRGNRASKLDAIHLEAFDSPNFPPLVTMGIHMQVHWERLWTPDPSKRLQVHTHLNPHVVALRLFPGISAETLSAFLHPSVQGVVVETFGAGNAPDQDVKLNAIFVEATQRGVVFVNCTQCVRGHVSDTYKTGKFLKHLGLIPGADMTPECALTKLTFVLGLAQELGQSSDWVRSQMQVALRGELSVKPHGLAGGLHVSKAAASGNLGTLVAMHAESIDVQWTALDFSGASPLHHAVQHGHLQALRIMLRSFHGPKDLLAVLDAHGFSPLGCACLKRFKTMALLLIHNGARFHPSESSLLWSSLCSVIEAGDVEWLNIYHHAGMDMNLQGLEKKSLLHIAVAYRQIPIVQYLVERKNTQLHLKDMYGFTPLDYLERMASFPSPLNDNENEASLSTFSKLKALLS